MTPGLDEILGPRAATLRAALDRVIPADDFPSACEAGVDSYLARQLAGGLAGRTRAYQLGLESLESESMARFGAAFTRVSPQRQDELLESAEPGFLSMLAAHAAEGYYGDPGNGGNKDCVSWRMVGFEPRWTVGEHHAGL